MIEHAATDNQSNTKPKAGHPIAYELRRLILLAVLPFVALIVLLAYFGYQEARRNAEGFVRREAVRVSLDVAGLLGETERGLRLVAARTAMKGVNPAQCDPWLTDLVAIQPRFLNVNVIDRDGWVICGATPPAGGPRSLNVSDREWFRAVASGQRFALGVPRKGPILGRWNSTAAVPIQETGGVFAGAVVAPIDLVGWAPYGTKGAIPEESVLGVISAAGIIVMRHPEADKWVGRDSRDTAIFADILRVRDGTFEAHGVLGFARIWSVTPIPGTDWLAYAGVRTSTVMGPPLKQIAFAVAAAVVALVIAVWLALLASRRLAQPIAGIAQAARTRASGSDDLVPVTGPSELMEVGEQLNRMILAQQEAHVLLRENSALLRIAGGLARFGGWSVNLAEGRVVWSDEVAAIHEMPPGHSPPVNEGIGYYAPEWRDKVTEVFDACARDGTPYDEELEIITVSGKRVWVRSIGEAVRDATGKITRVHGAFQDISERKAAEAALLELNNELEQKVHARTQALDQARREAEVASRAKSEFLAAMSHEIRTPMNGVVGMIDVLQQSSLRGDQVEMVDLIRESAFSLLGIIEDILDFSKIEAGKLELEREAFKIESLVEGVGSLLNDMALKKDVTLTLFVDPAIPAQVAGDALRLRQVLTNLINNAIKFSSGQPRPGRVSVRALLVEHSPQQVMVEFQVTDNGIGMDEKLRARLFTAFSQADPSTTRRFGGTGLGLVIAHHLVKLMGGEITVQSTAGEGTSFQIRLPFAPLPEPVNSKAPPSEVAGLHCVVVGNAGGLADDLAAYLVHAQAQVERATDLAGARQRQAGRNDLSVWVVDAGDQAQPTEHIRAAAQLDQAVRFVLVERGKRRGARGVASDTIMIDGNALSRRTLLRAVAVAGGRASPQTQAINPSSGKSTAIAPSREEALRERRLILIAEDNETSQKVIVRQLALLGYAADVAADGREALERWKSGDYALLLTDLHMPHMDGYELTRTIRAREAPGTHTPIIALTANALKGEGQRCRALGMDDYRSKPTPLSQLKAVLDQWLPAAVAADAPVASTPAAVVTRHSATAAPVDVDVLRELVGDDPQGVNEVLISFGENAATIAAELRAACAASQPAAAAATAHKLKSSARAVGAFALADLCEAIEREGKVGNVETLVTLLARFDEEMAAVKDYLHSHEHGSRLPSRR